MILKRTFTKAVSLVLSLAFLNITPLVKGERATESGEGIPTEVQAVTILKELNVIDDTFDENAYISRGDFLKIALSAMGKGEAGGGDIPYEDVTPDVPYYGAVCTAYSLGLISADTTFDGDSNITYAEAAKILVCLLNYKRDAEKNGGYPNGYTSVGYTLDLFVNVTCINDNPMSGSEAVTVIRNAMESHYLKESADGDLDKSDNLYMNDYLDIYKSRGIITADSEIDFDNDSLRQNEIKIDHEQMDTLYDVSSLVGQEVYYYYKQEGGLGTKTLLYAEPTSKNSTYEISSEDIESDTTTTTIYYTVGHSTKHKEIADDVVVIYNGKNIFAYKAEHLMPASGSVKLIDNDGDGKIDVAIVYNYAVAVVNSVNSSTETIVLKYGAAALRTGDYSKIVLKRDGNEIAYTDLKEWNVLSYYLVDDELHAMVTSNSVSGNIDAITHDDEEYTITVEGTEYDVSSNYIEDSGTLKAGERGVFGFDALGKIVYGDFSTTAKRNYSILLYASMDEDDTERVNIKLFNSKGKIDNALCAKKLKINDIVYEGEKALKTLEAIGFYQVIVTDSNTDGEVKEITFAKDHSADADYKGYDDENFTLDKSIDSVRYYCRWGAGCYIHSGIIIFSIPTDKTQIDLYKVEGQSKISDSDITISNVSYYDLDRFNYPSVMVISDFDQETPEDTVNVNLYDEWFVISDIKTVLNVDNEPRTKICGYHQNDYKEYWIAETGAHNVTNFIIPNEERMGNPVPNNDRTVWGFINHSYTDLRKGDILQLGYNSKDEISCYRMLWSSTLCGTDIRMDTDGKFGGNDYILYQPGDYYELNENITMSTNDPCMMTMCYTAFGEVTDVNGNFFRYKSMLSVRQGDEVVKYNTERVQQALGSVYIIDLQKKTATVTKGSSDDITIGDKVFVHVRDNRCFYMAIIRDNR